MLSSPRCISRCSLLFLLLATTCLLYRVVAFTPARQNELKRWNNRQRQSTRRHDTLLHALTPVGPFCPFRSSAAQEMEPRMDSLNAQTPEFATEMARIQLDMQTGNTPDPDRLRTVAKGILEAVEEWENLMMRLRLSNDFQTREYAKLTQAHLETHGMTADQVASMMRWQGQCMMAMANNTPPPFPPPDLDLEKMMAQSTEDNPPPSITSMTAAEKITSNPFTGEEEAFESPTVKSEYEQLCQDHAALIEMGASYANFDPSGKIAYLGEIEKIEERWDGFFFRFKLLGKLNPVFTKQCNDFLASMGMDEEQYRKLLKKTHDIMRDDAERERNTIPM